MSANLQPLNTQQRSLTIGVVQLADSNVKYSETNWRLACNCFVRRNIPTITPGVGMITAHVRPSCIACKPAFAALSTLFKP